MNLSLRIKAIIEGARELAGLNKSVGRLRDEAGRFLPDNTSKLREGMNRTSSLAKDLANELKGLFALGTIAAGIRAGINATRELESAFKGLEAVANSTGVGIERAWSIVGEVTSDQLMGMTEASRALQNLLARGFSADQAVAALNRLKDAAAFNRASHLSLGEAVVTATEGIKLESSELLDNAGIAKNISVIYEEYAEQVGKTANQLSEAEKTTAIYNGILRETEAQAGNAAKAAAGMEGNLAKLGRATKDIAVLFGDALRPAINTIARVGTNLINDFLKPGIGFFKGLGAYAAAAVKSVKDALSGNFAAIRGNFEMARDMTVDLMVEASKGVTETTKVIKDNINEELIARKLAQAAQEEQNKKNREAAAEQEKLYKKIQGTIDRLKIQATTLKMNEIEAELYRLKLQGASAAQLEAARAALIAIAAHEELVKAQKEATQAAKEAQNEELRRAETLAQSAEAVLNAIDPLRQLRQEEERLQMLRDRGYLTTQEYAKAQEELQERMRAVTEETDQMTQFSLQAARNIQTAFADFLFDPFKEGMDGMLTGFTTMLRRMAAEVAAQEVLRSLFRGLSRSSEGSGWGQMFATLAANVRHEGGLAGSGPRRQVPVAAFLGAPRLHNGGVLGLRSDEVPTILQRGEEVLTPSDPRHAANNGLAVNVTINALDSRSFLERAAEVRQELAIGVAQAMRGYNLGST